MSSATSRTATKRKAKLARSGKTRKRQLRSNGSTKSKEELFGDAPATK